MTQDNSSTVWKQDDNTALLARECMDDNTALLAWECMDDNTALLARECMDDNTALLAWECMDDNTVCNWGSENQHFNLMIVRDHSNI